MWSASAEFRMSGLSGMSGICGISGLFSLVVSLFFVCVSASPHATFRYQLLSTRRSEACSMCFADDCWVMERDRCRYYAEVHDTLPGETAGEEGGEVDSLMYDMVAQAASSWMSQECIPFISHHTDCNKGMKHPVTKGLAAAELLYGNLPPVSITDFSLVLVTAKNICVGCKSCSCDAGGRWKCKTVQHCRPEPTLDVDHKVLVSVQEALKGDKIARRKRNTKQKTKDFAKPHKISYVDIAEWMYGVKPDDYADTTERITNKMTTKRTPETADLTTHRNINIESEFIEFDEVLKNIAIDNQIYKRRKPQLNETNYEFKDYMDLDESVVIKNNESDPFEKMLNSIIEDSDNTTLEQTVEETTKMVIDLLQPPKDENSNVTITDNVSILPENLHLGMSMLTPRGRGVGYIDWKSNFIIEENNGNAVNDTLVYDAVNVMKRDISSVSNITTETTTEKINNTKPIDELKNSVLDPLTKIIYDKEQELKDLIKIKDNLIQIIRDYNSTNSEVDLKSQEVINKMNTVLSIYNLDIFPDIQSNLRKISPNSQDKLLYKLKRDIYEVIRDVAGIKKLYGGNKLPDDLKVLIRAMSLFVHKKGNVTNFIKGGIKLEDHRSLREQPNTEDSFNSTKDYLIKILEILNKDMPQKGALSPLSQGTRKVVARVIKNLHSDDFSVIALRVYDPEYNLSNDLKSIGSNWDHMTANVATSAPADKIYAMKLLHLIISVDINKLNDALALVDFAHSRRMIPIEGSREERELEKINNGLRDIDKKIQIIMRYKSGINVRSKLDPTKKPSKRKSFLNKIRILLKGSKSDIVEMVHQKVPKSEIVKTIAKKRLDEIARKKISEYQDTMRKWQNTLNVIPRYKRSIDLNKNRMKNIIPKYLRGKLDPAIVAKKSKPQPTAQNKVTLKKQINAKQKKVPTTVKSNTKVSKIKNAKYSKPIVRAKPSNKRKSKTKTRNTKSSNVRHH